MPTFPRNVDPYAALSALLATDKERISRQWAKRLEAELQETNVSARDLREPLARHVGELARLLRDRPEDTLRLWPEHVRAHGAGRFVQRFEADDVVREFKVLQDVLLARYAHQHGAIEPEVAQLLANLCGEASAAVLASFVRAVRTEEVRFREAGTMESILRHVDVGILLAGLDGAVSYVTPAAAALFGVPVRALVGARGADSLRAVLRQVKARHPDGERFRLADMPFARALQQRQAVRGVWMELDRPPDGQEVSVELSATPLFDDAGGELLGVLQTLTDRTETARKTRELSDAYDALRGLQGRMLQRTRQQALGQLASSTAHALNNFLNVLRLRITLLRRDFKPEHLDALERTTKNVGELVSRLQEFSSYRPDEEPGEFDLKPVLQEALEVLRPELERARPRIVLDAQLEGAGRARGDSTLLRELVVNLCLVAQEQMGQGGTLSVRASEEGGSLSIDVGFTGAPYSVDEVAQLFDPLKGHTRGPQLSLLLAVGRTQVQRWGGELWCENHAGEPPGAIFHIRLPAAEAAEPTPPPRPRLPAAPPLAQRRVLVVDDDPDNARMMARLLTEEGYSVAVAASGAEALQLWERHPFDAALLDALMQDTSGWDLARELRARAPNTLIAMVTGSDVRGQNRGTLALVDAVFKKPVDVAALDEFLVRAQPRLEGEPLAIH